MPTKTPYNTDALIKQSQAMLAQTKEQKDAPFAGSSYDTTVIPQTSIQPITAQTLSPKTAIDPVIVRQEPVAMSPMLPVPNDPSLDTESPATKLAKERELSIYNQLLGLNDETNALGSVDAFTAQQEAQQGIIAKKNTVNSIKNQFDAITKQNEGIDIQTAQILEQERAKGGSAFQLNANAQAVQRSADAQKLTNTIKQYELGAQYAIASGDLATALDYVDQAVKIEYKRKKDALDAKRANIELMLKDPTLTTAQEERAQELKRRYAQEDALLVEEANAKKNTEDAKIKILQNNPNISSTNRAILSKATSALEVANLANFLGLVSDKTIGGFELSPGQSRFDASGKLIASVPATKTATGGGAQLGSGSLPSGDTTRDAESVMNGTLNLQDISVKDNYRAGVAAELAKKQKEAIKTGDMAGVMKASAAYDKEPSDTFLQSMEKTLAVVSQLGVLQENIAGTNTGPIAGAFRGVNPWDTNAQTIKAQLNAIVPNLARGVYGEVGVLTDNDIKQYAKTIPTLTSTEDIRNAILYITLNQIRKNVAIKIENQASGQRDMSGYAKVYEDLDAQVKSILDTLPKTQQQTPATEEQAALRTKYNY